MSQGSGQESAAGRGQVTAHGGSTAHGVGVPGGDNLPGGEDVPGENPPGDESRTRGSLTSDHEGSGESEAAEPGQPEQATEVTEATDAKEVGERSADAFLTGCAYGALFLAGLAFGLIESFTYSLSVGPIPVAALGWSVFNYGAVLLAGRGMGAKLGASVPAVAWFLILFVMSPARVEGDVIITGAPVALIYMFGSTVAIVAGILRAPSAARPWLLVPTDPRVG